MFPPTIWLGTFWKMPIMMPGGSGWTTTFSTPPASAARAMSGRPANAAPAAADNARNSLRFIVILLPLAKKTPPHPQEGVAIDRAGSSAADRSRSARLQLKQRLPVRGHARVLPAADRHCSENVVVDLDGF